MADEIEFSNQHLKDWVEKIKAGLKLDKAKLMKITLVFEQDDITIKNSLTHKNFHEVHFCKKCGREYSE